MGREIILHRFNHGGEEFIGDIRHDKADGFFLAGTEASGGSVRRIAQLRNGFIDLLLGLAGNIAGRIDGVGDRGCGDTSQFRHVADGHLHIVHLFTQLFRFCVIICIL